MVTDAFLKQCQTQYVLIDTKAAITADKQRNRTALF